MNKIYSTVRQELRKESRQKRRAITQSERKSAADQFRTRLIDMRWFKNAKRIGLYIPNDGEIDPTGIIDRGEKMGKTFFLPILNPMGSNLLTHSQKLKFAPYSPKKSSLYLNRFKIPEPKVAFSQAVLSHTLDLIIMPLVCFDPYGNRLGMGGGFYDRTLARHYRSHPICIGAAYEVQKYTRIPTFDWDIPLHGIVTEEQFYPINGSCGTPELNQQEPLIETAEAC